MEFKFFCLQNKYRKKWSNNNVSLHKEYNETKDIRCDFTFVLHKSSSNVLT